MHLFRNFLIILGSVTFVSSIGIAIVLAMEIMDSKMLNRRLKILDEFDREQARKG
jgi:hypothetical protein